MNQGVFVSHNTSKTRGALLAASLWLKTVVMKNYTMFSVVRGLKHYNANP